MASNTESDATAAPGSALSGGATSRRGRQIHLVGGVLGLGGYLTGELLVHAQALRGSEAYLEALQAWRAILRGPVGLAIALLALCHMVIGLSLLRRFRPNPGLQSYSRNWTRTLQRLTGPLSLVFVACHLSRATWPLLRDPAGPLAFRSQVAAELSSTYQGVPVPAFFALIGVVVVAFHGGAGLHQALVRFGWLAQKNRQVAGLAIFCFCGLLVLLATATVLFHATGTRQLA